MPGDEITTPSSSSTTIGGTATPSPVSLDRETFSKADVEALIAERNRALEANRNEVLAELKRTRSKLASLDGVDVEEYKTLKSEHDQLEQEKERIERERAEKEGNYKAALEQVERKKEAAIQKEREEKEGVLRDLNTLLIDNAALLELSKHSETPHLLLPHVVARMRVVQEDGKRVARIVDPATGTVRISPTGRGSEPMTLAELMDEMRNDKQFAVAFKGSGSSGGGALRSHASGGAPSKSAITTDDGQEFLKHIKEIKAGTITVQRTNP